jgi:hypothetical protein
VVIMRKGVTPSAALGHFWLQTLQFAPRRSGLPTKGMVAYERRAAVCPHRFSACKGPQVAILIEPERNAPTHGRSPL